MFPDSLIHTFRNFGLAYSVLPDQQSKQRLYQGKWILFTEFATFVPMIPPASNVEQVLGFCQGLPGGFLWKVGLKLGSAGTTAFSSFSLTSSFPTCATYPTLGSRPPGVLRVQEEGLGLYCSARVEVHALGSQLFKSANCIYDLA